MAQDNWTKSAIKFFNESPALLDFVNWSQHIFWRILAVPRYQNVQMEEPGKVEKHKYLKIEF